MYRLLKPGGVLITSTDYYPTPIDTHGQFAHGTPIKIFSKPEIEAALAVGEVGGIRTDGRTSIWSAKRSRFAGSSSAWNTHCPVHAAEAELGRRPLQIQAKIFLHESIISFATYSITVTPRKTLLHTRVIRLQQLLLDRARLGIVNFGAIQHQPHTRSVDRTVASNPRLAGFTSTSFGRGALPPGSQFR